MTAERIRPDFSFLTSAVIDRRYNGIEAV